jgi:cytochrome c-type biogenesis protein CcmH
MEWLDFKPARRVGEIRVKLKALNAANASGALTLEQYIAQRQALGDALLSYIDTEPKHIGSMGYTAIALAVLLPLAAFGLYRWSGTPPALQSHAAMTGAAAPLQDHGADIQAAISKLAAKLREHPDDAEGWALLGRTYKATEHYAEARDAFKHAVAAAPNDSDLAREYAAAEKPNAVSSDELSARDSTGIAAPKDH